MIDLLSASNDTMELRTFRGERFTLRLLKSQKLCRVERSHLTRFSGICDASFVNHGFVRDRDGTFTTFDPPGASGTQPTAINPARGNQWFVFWRKRYPRLPPAVSPICFQH